MLEEKRKRGDMITTFMIVNLFYNEDNDQLFKVKINSTTKGITN